MVATSRAEGPSTPRATLPLATCYFLYFAALGITLPFLPVYLLDLRLSATQVGILLALTPAISLFAPPRWGRLADRTGNARDVLGLVSLGALAAFAPLLGVHRFPGLLLCLAAYACFAGAITPISDALTLSAVEKESRSYAHVRLFGSVGFVIATIAFGLVPHVPKAVIAVPLVLMAAFTFATRLILRAPNAPVPVRTLGTNPLRGREPLILLAACCLHWIACAPFHGDLSIHVQALGLPASVVGISAGLGVGAEVGVMALYPRVRRVLSPRAVLALAFAGSALRWAGMALTSSGGAIEGLSLLHGLSFGAFYVAAVDAVSLRVPALQRATGQAIFAAATFGLGGIAGYIGAGIGFDRVGGHRLFGAAAVVELLALAAVALTSAHPPPGQARNAPASMEAAGA